MTGGSRGIGAVTAKLLAGDGATVVVNYRDKAKRAEQVVAEIARAGGRAVAVRADLTDAAELDAMFGSIERLDVLVLNASGGMERDADAGYALRLNRDAQVAVLERAVQRMEKGSRVVFVTSHQAHGAGAIPTVEEFAAAVAAAATADVPSGHTVYVGGDDYLE